MSASHKGKRPSPETLAKISGPNNHFFGKHHTPAVKGKIIAALRGERTATTKRGTRRRRINNDGYALVYCPSHPYAGFGGMVLEHRLVVEAHIGRVLEPTEVIHHINGKRTDNRIENLMRFSANGDHTSWHNNLRKEA